MNRSAQMGLLAVVSFGLGMAVDRMMFVSEPTPEVEQTTVEARVRDRSFQNSTAGKVGARSVERIRSGEAVGIDQVAGLLAKLPPGDERMEAIEQFAREMAISNPQEALKWAATLEGRERWAAVESIFRRLAGEDPVTAAELAAGLPKSERMLDLVHWMVSEWAEQDRDAAMTWAIAQDNPAVRRRAIEGGMQRWADLDPESAAAFAMSLEDRELRMEALEISAHHWVNHDQDRAVAWAQSLQGAAGARAKMAVLHEISEHDPHEGADLFDELRKGLHERAQRRMAQELAERWAHSDPEAAAFWAVDAAADLEDGHEVIHGAVGPWLHADEDAATTWVSSLPVGTVRDAATERVVHFKMDQSIGNAFSWAAQLNEHERRIRLTHHVLEEWREVDPEAARAAYDQAGFQGEARRHLGVIFGIEFGESGGE